MLTVQVGLVLLTLKNDMKFKEYILEEQKTYLTQKVGDILSATQELSNDAKNMGSRDLARFSERIVNQIRRILHSNWSRENKKYLEKLQKIGISIIKAIKEKGDLEGTISGAKDHLEKLISDLGLPINSLASPDTPKTQTTDDTNNIPNPEQDNKKKSDEQDPKIIEKIKQSVPPVNNDPELIGDPPLGGNSGTTLSAM